MKEFPSPESLKGRIIISTKPPVEGLQEAQAANQAPVRQLEKVDKEEKKKRSPVVKEEALAEKVEKFQIDGADTKVVADSGSTKFLFNLCKFIFIYEEASFRTRGD